MLQKVWDWWLWATWSERFVVALLALAPISIILLFLWGLAAGDSNTEGETISNASQLIVAVAVS